MSIGSAGLGAAKPPPPPPVNAKGNQAGQAIGSRPGTTTGANTPSAARGVGGPPPAVFVPTTPGGTTAPAQSNTGVAVGPRGLAQGVPPPVAAQANAVAALLNNAQGLSFLAGGKVSSETKQKRGVGDAKEDSGDIQVETQAEAKGDQALKDSNSETGQGDDLSAATNAGSVAT